MSVHAMIAAAYLEDLTPGTKLVLMAVCDSADEHTLEAAPGLPKLRAWSGLGRSQTLRVVSELTMPIEGQRPRYLKRIAQGRTGRRAVYQVFPDGLPRIPHPSEVAARYALPTVGDDVVDNGLGEGRTDATLDYNQGPISTDQGPTQTGPLHASTSVLERERDNQPVNNPSSRPAPPAARTGFPGARTPTVDDDAQGIARRARGAADVACPFHPDQVVPCGRCAHRAATSDPAAIAAARQLARQGIAANRRPTTEETP